MSDDQQWHSGENLPAVPEDRRDILVLGNRTQLDLSSLSESDRNALKVACLKGQIELQHKMAELGIDNQALEQRLGDMAETVARATNAGASATVTGAYTDKMGRTEVIMGNTETAARGKLDRSQKGEPEKTLVYVIIGAVVLLILAALIMGR